MVSEDTNINNTLLVVNVKSNALSFINGNTLRTENELSLNFRPHEIAITPNGRHALVSNFGDALGLRPGQTLTLIDIETRSIAGEIMLEHGSRPHGMAFLDDERAIVTAQGKQLIYMVNMKHMAIEKKCRLPNAGAHMVLVDAKKNFAYVSNSNSGSVTKINLTGFYVCANFQFGDHAGGMALAQDGRLFVTNRKQNLIHVLDAANMKRLKILATDRAPSRLALYNQDSRLIVTNAISGTAQVFDTSNYELQQRFKTRAYTSKQNGSFFGSLLPLPLSVTVRETDQSAFISNFFSGTISQIKLATGEFLHAFEAQKGPDAMVFATTFSP